MIRKFRFYLFVLISFLVYSSTFAQKVKYKDLFVLLSASDYEQAEPFLRRFIKQEPDHPNATMHMGRLYEHKIVNQDFLRDTEQFISYCDSAVYYYRLAHKLIDDREIRKNDEYYQEYSRRDLRTGKFGVKLADVQFDIESRINDIEDLSSSASRSKESFEKARSSYTGAEDIFNSFVEEFRSTTALLLKSDDSDIDDLNRMSKLYTEFSKNFENYKQSLRSVPNSKYEQELSVESIEELKELESPDFFSEEVNVYDFKSWSEKMAKAIVDDIRPMKANMASYDEQLDELYKQAKEDSMTVENELASLTEKMFLEQLDNYDPNPLPSLIFNFKVDEITYYSYLNHQKDRGYLDSANVDFQLELYQDLNEKFGWVDESFSNLLKVNALEKADLYSEFVIERFGDVTGLVNFIAEKGEEVTEIKSELAEKILDLKERARWGIYENDSIPLFVIDSAILHPDASRFTYNTLVVDSLEKGYAAMGIRYKGNEIENFASKIGFDRKLDTIFVKTLDFNIELDSTATIKGWSESYVGGGDDEEGIIYVFRVKSGETSNFEISKFTPQVGLEWSSAFKHSASLLELTVDTNTSLIVLKMGDDTDGTTGESENLIFNFDGAILTTQD